MKTFVSDEYDDRPRRLARKRCRQCKKLFAVPLHTYKKRQACSRKCAGLIVRSKRVRKKCAYCQKLMTKVASRFASYKAKSGFFFCDRRCKERAQSLEGGLKEIQPAHYKDGKAVYRKKALAAYGTKCSKCKYDVDVRMLDVDHIDGDRKNNHLKNLRVLCVWCHATYTRSVKWHRWIDRKR